MKSGSGRVNDRHRKWSVISRDMKAILEIRSHDVAEKVQVWDGRKLDLIDTVLWADYVPSRFICWSLCSTVMVSGSGVFGRFGCGLRGDKISALLWEEKHSALFSVKDVRLRWEVGSLQPRRELSTGPNCPEGYLDLMEISWGWNDFKWNYFSKICSAVWYLLGQFFLLNLLNW